MPLPRVRASRVSIEPRSTISRVYNGSTFIETSNQSQQTILPFSVNMNKTALRFLGSRAFPGQDADPWQAPQAQHTRVTLTLPNTVSCDIYRIPGQSPSAVDVRWELTEYA